MRFLCLAAALVTSVGSFDGANAIITMMNDFKLHEKQVIPTPRQLVDILKSLEAKSAFCGFAELMVQWEIHLRQEVFPRAFDPMAETRDASSQERLDLARKLILKGHPPPHIIARIVDAFKTVAIVKYRAIAEVEIKVGTGAAWVLAFTQWCFGTPPALFLEVPVDGGHTYERISGSPASLVKVTIPAPSSNEFTEIVVRSGVKLSSENLTPAVNSDCYGMVCIETYGQWLLHEFGFADESSRQLLYELLRFAIPEILPKLTCGKFGRLGQNSGLVGNYSVSDPLEFNHPTALPDISKLEKICNIITGKTIVPQKFTIRQDATLVVRKLVKDHLEKECRCADCHGRDGKSTSKSETCPVQEFYLNFSTILVDILALSLFENPESLLVRPSHDRHNADQLKYTVCEVLRDGEPRVFDDGHLLQWARAMVGHVYDDKDRRLIVTSGRGQVVYPSVYEYQRIERVGYLRLSHFRGVLKYEGDVYNVVASLDIGAHNVSDEPEQPIYEGNQNPGILRPMNLFDHISVSWEAFTQDLGEIRAFLLIHTRGSNSIAARNLSLFITALKDTFFYEDCQHDGRSWLEEADRFTTIQSPWSEAVAENDENSHVRIIAVDGSEDLRLLALLHANGPVVLRRDACLRCCLDLCRRTATRRLIL
ncbi:hypothetical protein J3E68DRAFT_400324 [Trichoderma sp. SZMC 28012]